MLFHSNASSTPTPGSSASTSNTLEPVNTFTNSSSSQLHQHLQQSSSLSFSLQQSQQKQQQMGCISTLNSRPPSRAPSILDSPTLARVERARLKLEASAQPQHNINGSCCSISNTLNGEDSLERVVVDPNKQSLLAGRIPVSAMTGPIKRGLLWQQRDRLFSRWKERYFVLTRDYLHCFKRASGSANERASDMGQFIFKVKLVDVEKVEWLNRRSYSAIGLLLGREGRVLLRCDEGLEDWFELLEECTITSKERRKALKIAQGPRSRASLAAPVSHASLQRNHFSLGGTYLTALDDWLMTNGNSIAGSRNQKLVTNSICGYGGTNPFLFSDSVPDLSTLNNENHNHISGISTNHSTPQKTPYSSAVNNSRYSNGYASQNGSSSYGNGLYGSPRRIFINSSFGSTHIVDEEAEDGEVELRRPRIFRHLSTDNGNEIERDWLYRKPKPPTDMRHSVQPILPTTQNNTSFHKLSSDVDHSANDSGVETPPSTHRPSSYREQTQCYNQQFQKPSRDSTETSVSSSRGTILNSPGGSFRAKHVQQISNLNNFGTRYTIQERILKIRNEEDHYSSIKSANHSNQNDLCDPNQNRYHKIGIQSPVSITSQNAPNKKIVHSQQHLPLNLNGNSNSNNNNNNNNNNITNGSAICRERYQHPALTALINDTQSMIHRDRSYSDCVSSRRSLNNNLSPLTGRKNHINPLFGTPTRV